MLLAAACTGSDDSDLGGGSLEGRPPPSSSSGAPRDGGVEPNERCPSVTGTVSGTGSSGLRVRAEPTTESAANSTVREGATVAIICQTPGEAVDGNETWYFLGADGYVAGAYVTTDDRVAACTDALLACGAREPPPDPPASGEDTPPSPIGSSPEVEVQGPAIEPQVQAFANDVCAVVGACTLSTYAGHSPTAELALDILTSDEYGEMPTDDFAFGDRVADYARNNKAAYRIDYVIYRQRIDMGEGWDDMADRGSITENHYDHVHVSFDP